MSKATLEEKTIKNKTIISEAYPEIIHKQYPEKENHIRRIAHIWGPFYRINFIHQDTGYVTYSAFIKVKGDIITEEGA